MNYDEVACVPECQDPMPNWESIAVKLVASGADINLFIQALDERFREPIEF